jgi:hypothetical protein
MAYKIASAQGVKGTKDPLPDSVLDAIATEYNSKDTNYPIDLKRAYAFWLPYWENPIVREAIMYIPDGNTRYRPTSLLSCTSEFDKNYTIAERPDEELCGGTCANGEAVNPPTGCPGTPLWCWQFAIHVVNNALGTSFVNPEDGGTEFTLSSSADLDNLKPGDILYWETSIDGKVVGGHWDLFMGSTNDGGKRTIQMIDGNWGNRVDNNSFEISDSLTFTTSTKTTLQLKAARRFLE